MAQPVIKNSAEELVLDFAERAKESGFVVNVRRTPNLTDLSICLSRNCTLRLEIVKEDQTTVSAWIFVRTHSENFEGERSDLNDLLSVVELIALCTVGELSPSLLSYAYPAIDEPAGVYARVIMFERDGILGCVPSELTIAKFERILRSSLLGVECMAKMLSREHVPDWRSSEQLANRLSRVLGADGVADGVNYSARKNPSWAWYHDAKKGVSLFQVPGLGTQLLVLFKQQTERLRVEGPTGQIFIRGSVRQFVPNCRMSLALQLINQVEFLPVASAFVVPAESCFVAISRNAVVLLEGGCGRSAVTEELTRIRSRQAQERHLLFAPLNFSWKTQLDDERFEEFVRALLVVEPGVRRVRRVGRAREPDGGRDLEADWLLPSNALPSSDSDSPYSVCRVLIQCKAVMGSVNKDKVRDIRDTIEYHNAAGYLLVVSSTCTAPLIGHLNKLREESSYLVDWWTRDEIEDRARANPEVVERFPDVLIALD